MGPGANPQVVTEVPVIEVVPALPAGLRIRGDLVMGKSARARRSSQLVSIWAAVSSSGRGGGSAANTVPGSSVSW